MNYFIKTLKDTAIYSGFPTLNFGLSEILEINKELINHSISNSRILMQFDVNDIANAIEKFSISTFKCYLILKPVVFNEIPEEFILEIMPLSTSWSAGYGKKTYRIMSTQDSTWQNNQTEHAWTHAGGDYLTDNKIEYTFDGLKSPDLLQKIEIDVTDIVNLWIDHIDTNTGAQISAIDNNGIIIKKTDADEINNLVITNIKFYGNDTNTIYVPQLRLCWDDYSTVYDVQGNEVISLPVLTDLDNMYIYFPSLQKKYSVNTSAKIRVNARKQIYDKKFTDSISYNSTIDEKDLYRYEEIEYLPETSYYKIVDALTNEDVIPVSDFTKISRDTLGNYFNINFHNFMPKRYYKIMIYVIDNNIDVLNDNNNIFEVDR